jgi:hypothetical protein
MGTPCLNWRYQGVGKLYRLQTPASPFFRPVHYDTLDMDNFPMGTNAIVAVISYTVRQLELKHPATIFLSINGFFKLKFGPKER